MAICRLSGDDLLLIGVVNEAVDDVFLGLLERLCAKVGVGAVVCGGRTRCGGGCGRGSGLRLLVA